MEFAWNTQKNKITDVKGLEKELNREGKISNLDIDINKTHLNYDLIQNNLSLYQRIKNRIEEVKPVSRIQKNSVVDYSNIITVPKAQSELWGIEKTKDYFKATYDYFCDEFGKENIMSAKVHLDETAPHMHLHFVPVNLENGKLQARKVMTPQRINKIHTEAPKRFKELGFDVIRGNGKTKEKGNIKDIHEFKKKKSKELECKIDTLAERLNALLSVSDEIDNIQSIKTQKTLLGGKISLREGDYEKIISKVNNLLIENHNLKQENKDFKEKNDLLTKKLDKADNKIKHFDYRAVDFDKRKEELRDELFKDYRNIRIENIKLDANVRELKKKNENLEKNNLKLKKDFFDLKEFAIKNGVLKREKNIGLNR